jgi:predicted phage terminase large subunit-like protein|nr:MAG TPA: Terminase large subunit [Bacteriophage sp.]
MKINPDEIVQAAARKRLTNFAKYVKGDLNFAPFHEVYYTLLDLFAHGVIKKMIVQIPAQHGKSEGSSRLLPSFMLGLDPDLKICIGSYAATIAQDFNRDVQKIIDAPEYQDIFHETFLNSSNVVTMANTSLKNSTVIEMVGHKGSLRVVGRGGSLTSKTVDIMIMDDIYKDYQEANSPIVREAAWKWYTTVVKTRLHNNSQELIVFTRWHEDDLIGRIERSEEVVDFTSWEDLKHIDNSKWLRINFEALKTTPPNDIDPREVGEALWEERHSRKRLEAMRALDPVQFECLQQGNPRSAEGRLYTTFKTYVDQSEYGKLVRKGCYVDVADEGDDYLSAATYDIYVSPHEAYNERKQRFEPIVYALITDIEFTQANTDVTTLTVPNMINRNGTQKAWIESNNGGSGFEKVVRKKVKALTYPFHQTNNKESRIVSKAAFVNAQIVFPFGWETRFATFYDHISRFLRNFGANKHDDAADMLTGIYEKEIENGNFGKYKENSGGITYYN